MIQSNSNFINKSNLVQGRYLCKEVTREDFPEARLFWDLFSVRVGRYQFSARPGGPIHIFERLKNGDLQVLTVLRKFKCDRMVYRDDKLYVESDDSFYSLDFNSPAAKTHFSDSRIAKIFFDCWAL